MPEDILDPINNYIKIRRSQQATDSKIQEELLQSGHSPESIAHFFSKAPNHFKNSKPKSNQQFIHKHSRLLIASGSIFILIYISSLYLIWNYL